jgi:outer membrane receptor for ferrienterochelin and colicin
VLNVGREVRLNIALAVAATSESVTVKADASMLSTAVTGMGETLNEAAVRNLPIASRNIYNLHLVGPGIKGLPSSNAATTVFYTGGLTRTTWTVDGMDSTSRRNARQIRMGVITPEAVEEMQLLSGGTSAEFGRSAGAIINVVTRGGTNQFHGSGMWMYRPNALVARPPLAVASVDQSWWLAAGNFAGPIVRDRLWFFLNDEYNPYREPQPVTITAANAQALGLSAEDTANSEYGETYHSPSAKVNFQFNPRNSGFVRYGQFSNSQPVGRTGLTLARRTTDYADKQNTGAVQWTSILTPSLLSESRFGVNRRIETRSPVGKADANGAFINIQGVANIGVNPLAFNEESRNRVRAARTSSGPRAATR